MRLRTWGLLGSGALHVAAALIWLSDPTRRTTEPSSPSTLVSLRLLAAPERVVDVAPVLKPSVFKTRAVPVAIVAAPALPSVLASPSVAVAAAEPVVALVTTPVAITPAAAVVVEPDYRAATPPDRACTERNVARLYPPLLRERGIEGQVLLRVRVDEQGQAAEVIVQGGSGWRLLDEAARLLTRGCSFSPARRGEQALASWVEYPVRFALNGAVNQ